MTISRRSPFKDSGALREGHAYVERAADANLLRVLKDGEYCYVLAPRQSGKSSMAHHTAGILRADGYRCGRVDLSQLIDKESSQRAFYQSVAAKIVQRIGGWGQPDDFVGRYFTDKKDLPAVHVFTSFVAEQLMFHLEGPVVIFVDELDALARRPDIGETFFPVVRSLCEGRAENRALDRLTICLLGVYSRHELSLDPNTTPFNIGAEIQLDDFTSAEVDSFSDWLTDCEQPELVLGPIYRWTNGVPWMVQRLLGIFYERQSSPDPLQPSDYGPWVDETVRRVFLHLIVDETSAKDDIRYAGRYLTQPRDDSYGPSLTEALEALSLYRTLLDGQEHDYDPNEPLHALLYLAGLASRRRTDDASRAKLQIRSDIYRSLYNGNWIQEAERKLLVRHRLRQWMNNDRSDQFLLQGPALEQTVEYARQVGSTAKWDRNSASGAHSRLFEFLMYSVLAQRDHEVGQLRLEQRDLRSTLEDDVRRLKAELGERTGDVRVRPAIVVGVAAAALAVGILGGWFAVGRTATVLPQPSSSSPPEALSVADASTRLSPAAINRVADGDEAKRAYLESKYLKPPPPKERPKQLVEAREKIAAMTEEGDFNDVEMALLAYGDQPDLESDLKIASEFWWLAGMYVANSRGILSERSYFEAQWRSNMESIDSSVLRPDEAVMRSYVLWHDSATGATIKTSPGQQAAENRDVHSAQSDSALKTILDADGVEHLPRFFKSFDRVGLQAQLKERNLKRAYAKRRIVVFDCSNLLGTDDPQRGRAFVQILFNMGFSRENVALEREPLSDKDCDMIETDECMYVDDAGRELCATLMSAVTIPGSREPLGKVLETRQVPRTRDEWNKEVGSISDDKFRRPIRTALLGSETFRLKPDATATAEIAIRLGRQYYYKTGGE